MCAAASWEPVHTAPASLAVAAFGWCAPVVIRRVASAMREPTTFECSPAVLISGRSVSMFHWMGSEAHCEGSSSAPLYYALVLLCHELRLLRFPYTFDSRFLLSFVPPLLELPCASMHGEGRCCAHVSLVLPALPATHMTFLYRAMLRQYSTFEVK